MVLLNAHGKQQRTCRDSQLEEPSTSDSIVKRTTDCKKIRHRQTSPDPAKVMRCTLFKTKRYFFLIETKMM